MTTMEVTLERVDNIVNMLDEICDHMDGFVRRKRHGFPASRKRCAPGATLCRNLRKPEICRTHVHCGFIWTSRCSGIGPAVGRVSADRHRFAVVPAAPNSFAALTGRPP